MAEGSDLARAVDAVMDAFVARGGRRTAARRAIVEALAGGEGHPSADDLVAEVQRRHPSTNRSTVYRTLDALEQMGVVHHVHFGHGRAVYQLTAEGHQHLYCEGCGAVCELDAEELAPLLDAVAARHGFTVDVRHFALAGRCASCGSGAGDDVSS